MAMWRQQIWQPILLLLWIEQRSVIKSLKSQSWMLDKFYYLVGNMKH